MVLSQASMIYYDLPTLRIKVELTEGENDPWLFLTITQIKATPRDHDGYDMTVA